MLEKLLRRLVDRNGSASTPHLSADTYLLSAAHAPSSLSDSELRPFPARSYITRSPIQREATAYTWAGACKAHFEGCVNPIHPPQLPALFATYGGGHATLAQALWTGHKRCYPMLVHISGPQGMVAVYDQVQQRVWVRLNLPYTEPHALDWMEMPASTMPPEDADYQSTTVHHLLWYFGQTAPLAPAVLPIEMGSAPLQLRRFPPVDPQALDMRHLALLRLLSAGALTFDQLQHRTSPIDRGHLCGDLASLYFTGSLVLLAQSQSSEAVLTYHGHP